MRAEDWVATCDSYFHLTGTSADDLVAALGRLRPDIREQLHDSLYNFAVNDALVLHGADDYPLQPGDTVEIVPTIAGG